MQIATASVISGLDLGVKYLSLFAFFLGMLLLFLVFVMDNTKYLLNLTVQETGYYIQHSLIELNFWYVRLVDAMFAVCPSISMH